MAKTSEKIDKLEKAFVQLDEKVNYAIKLLERINGKLVEHEKRIQEVEENLAVINSLNLTQRLSEYDKVRWAIITIIGLAGVIFAVIKLFIR